VKRQTLALVVIGLLLFVAGGGIAFVTVVHGTKNHSNPPTTVAPVNTPAVVVTADVPAGTTGQDMVAQGLVAVQLIPQKTKGDAIRTTELTASTTAISLPKGQDAVSVTTTGVAGLAGYLQPGSNVDVYANVTKLSVVPVPGAIPVPVNTPVPCIELTMTDIEVLDVSQIVPALSTGNSTTATTTATTTAGSTSTGRVIPPNLTLLLSVSPAQAQEITFMTQNETLSVAQTQTGTTPPPLGVCLSTGNLTTGP
jgi:Flp pilus assembly protein CpaB